MRHADGRQIEDRPKMQGETGAARTVAAGRIVRITRFARDDSGRDCTPAVGRRRSRGSIGKARTSSSAEPGQASTGSYWR
jgi:hypothetical protein